MKKPKTTNERQHKRDAELDRLAGLAGYLNPKTGKPSFSAYKTALINGKAKINPATE
jgi:hypothetical protein